MFLSGMASIKGRGAPSNIVSTRFNLPERQEDGDWQDMADDIDGPAERPRTQVSIERARTIITRNTSPDIGFDRSVNAYRGCEHGCIYCYARPSHAFHDLSPGLDFETRLFVKPDAASLLRRELGKKGYVPAPIAMGTNTDPYQPIEKQWRITRQCIDVLAECDHPLTITTKSDRVLRDKEILADMARKNLVRIAISVTSLDPVVARTLEPRAPHPEKRLAAIAALARAGIPAFASISPVIPAITDHEMERIIERIAQAGALGAFYIPVRLPHEVAPLFRQWLDSHFPDRAGKVMTIIHDMRGGRDNDPRFHQRFRGQGVWGDLLRARFRKAMARSGLPHPVPPLRTDLFRPPEGPQYRLF